MGMVARSRANDVSTWQRLTIISMRSMQGGCGYITVRDNRTHNSRHAHFATEACMQDRVRSCAHTPQAA